MCDAQSPDQDDRVVVARRDGEYCVLAGESIAAGEPILTIRGRQTAMPTKFSLQIGPGSHLDVDHDTTAEAVAIQPWRFTNHSCDPNAKVTGRRLVAIRDIAEGEQVTFNYNTTEFSIAEPFECRCGSPRCLQTIAGFRHLDADARERLRPWLASHLVEWLEAQER